MVIRLLVLLRRQCWETELNDSHNCGCVYFVSLVSALGEISSKESSCLACNEMAPSSLWNHTKTLSHFFNLKIHFILNMITLNLLLLLLLSLGARRGKHFFFYSQYCKNPCMFLQLKDISVRQETFCFFFFFNYLECL